MKKGKIDFHCKSIYQVDPLFFKELGIKYLVVDLDNTLSVPHLNVPSLDSVNLKNTLEKMGITLIVLSNNFPYRVRPYCQSLGVIYLSFSLKFFAFRIRGFLKKKQIKIEECLFAGDQLITDMNYANKLKGRFLLTEPLVEKDNFFAALTRKKDAKRRRLMKESNQLGLECPTIKRGA